MLEIVVIILQQPKQIYLLRCCSDVSKRESQYVKIVELFYATHAHIPPYLTSR